MSSKITILDCKTIAWTPCHNQPFPICGSDRKTYRNRCKFKQAQCKKNGLKQNHAGKCKGM